VWASAVVVTDVLVECSAEVSFADDEQAVGDLAAYGADESLRVCVGLRAARRVLADRDAGVGEHGVEGVGELARSVPDEDLELVGASFEVHEQVSGLLGGPRPIRIGRDAEDVDIAAADLENEEHVQALQGEGAVDVEEVAGQHGRGLAGHETPPPGAIVAHRCWWDAVPLVSSVRVL
jgi:hypothetical protein